MSVRRKGASGVGASPVAVIGVPTRYGTGFPGSEQMPTWLRASGLLDRLSGGPMPLVDMGNVPVPAGPWMGAEFPLHALAHVQAVAEAQAAMVAGAVGAGMLPLVIGGDCTTLLGTAAGLWRAGCSFGLVCLDAHGDFNTEATTPSGNIHGMAVATIAGRGAPALRALVGAPHAVPERQIVLLGVRDLDPPEAAALAESAVTVVPPAQLRLIGAWSVGKLAARLATSGASRLLLHLDLDVVDPTEAPGVGLPVPGGLRGDELLSALDALLASGRVAAIELTEAAPTLDPTGRTARFLERLFERLLAGIERETSFNS